MMLRYSLWSAREGLLGYIPFGLAMTVLGACASERSAMEAALDPFADLRAEPGRETPAREPSTVPRSRVRQAIKEGPGAFLQRVELSDTPVFRDGSFFGFRLSSLRGDPGFWRGVDLRPGDIVTRVNGFSVGHENSVWRALRSLDVASELVIEYERAGVARELRYEIVEDEQPDKSR